MSELLQRIEARSARCGVIGLGYVGLPLALAFARQGFTVLGFDIDPAKVDSLNRGRSYIDHIESGELAGLVEAGRLAATSEGDRLAEPDALLLCVPTPLTPRRDRRS
jgi:UDP-N-acetyl-D-glucosamine dehydrogenase